MMECLTFSPLYMERVWGGRKLHSLFRRTLPAGAIIGESWELVDREDTQSIVTSGQFKGLSLEELWTRRRPEIFGEGYSQPRFPILIKILDASHPLSIQVHPPPYQAANLDGEPKTEFWYFVDADPGAGIYVGLKRGTCREDFAVALDKGSVAELVHWAPTRPDCFILLPSGRLHAIDAGNVIFEIQQNSDTTYRVFDWNRPGLDGKLRKLQVPESLQSIDFDDFEPYCEEHLNELLIDCPHFRIDRWRFDMPRGANEEPKFSVFQVVQGAVEFGSRRFRRGDLFMVPASAHDGQVIPKNGSAVVLRTRL
jgi:mannose-6-phosphate isomerase